MYPLKRLTYMKVIYLVKKLTSDSQVALEDLQCVGAPGLLYHNYLYVKINICIYIDYRFLKIKSYLEVCRRNSLYSL